MTHKSSTLAGLLFVALSAAGQNQVFPEPQYNVQIVTITEGQDIPVEMQKVYIHSDASWSMYFLGVGTIKFAEVVPALRSPTRINGGENVKFVIKGVSDTVDIAQRLRVFQIHQDFNKLYRYKLASKFGTFTGSKKSKTDFIPFHVKKYGDASYLVEIQKLLIPGEYAMTMKGTPNMFNLFGVDW